MISVGPSAMTVESGDSRDSARWRLLPSFFGGIRGSAYFSSAFLRLEGWFWVFRTNFRATGLGLEMPCQKLGSVGGVGDFERSVNGLVDRRAVESGSMLLVVFCCRLLR